MTRINKHNQGVMLRANVFNAVAVGSIVVGGFSTVTNAQIAPAMLFLIIGLLTHQLARAIAQELEVWP